MKAKKLLTLLVAVMLLFTFAGCNMIFVNKELDRQQVVAVVNGVEILKSTLLDDYDSYKYMYDITDANEMSAANAEKVKSIKETIYDELVSYEVIYQKAKEFGVEELSKEQQEEIDNYVEMRKNSILNSVTTEVDEELKENPNLDREAEIKTRSEAQYASDGLLNGTYAARMSRDKVRQNVQAYLGKDYVVPDEELHTFYDENLASQKADLANSPKNYELYENIGYALYVPEGIRFVKNLLIALPDDVQEQLKTLRADKKDAEADALRDAELAKIRARADEVYAKAAAGEDFDALLEQYGDDPGMKSGNAKERGYLIYEGLEDFDEIFVKAGMALQKVGDVGTPAGSDFGYYIVQYAQQPTPGERSFEDTVDGFYDVVKDELVGRLYDSSVVEWREAADIKEYKDRIY